MSYMFSNICPEGQYKEECNVALNNTDNIINPYDYIRSLLIALFIREIITIPTIIKQIYIENYKFNIGFIEYLFPLDSNNIDNLFTQINETLTKVPFVIIYLHVSYPKPNQAPKLNHVNMILVKKFEYGKHYYYYEPHNNYDYDYIKLFKTNANRFQYLDIQLPNNLLKQVSLPFCYMYCLHFFIHIIINQNNERYMQVCDNLYIMRFITDIFKLCYRYNIIPDFPITNTKLDNKINSAIIYYLLTNNTYKMRELLTAHKPDLNISIVLMKSSKKMSDLFKELNIVVKQSDILDEKYLYSITKQLYREKIKNKNLDPLDNINLLLINILFNVTNVMHVAIVRENMEIIEFLLANIPDVNLRAGPYNLTPLGLAISMRNLGMVQLLLNNEKVNVNLQCNASGHTPLGLAIDIRNIEIVQLLLSNKKVDINLQFDTGKGTYTPLGLAIGMRNLEMVQLLLNNEKVNVNLRCNAGGHTPLGYAIGMINLEMVQLLLNNEKVDVNLICHTMGITPLGYAIQITNIEIVQLLLNNDKVNVNLQCNAIGNTPLGFAIIIKNIEIVQLLLSNKKVDINLQFDTRTGTYTPLNFAMKEAENNKSDVEKHAIINKIIKLLSSRDVDELYVNKYYKYKNKYIELKKNRQKI